MDNVPVRKTLIVLLIVLALAAIAVLTLVVRADEFLDAAKEGAVQSAPFDFSTAVIIGTADKGPYFSYDAKCISVHDGDTITVLKSKEKTTVRLNYIDAPELTQRFGSNSKNQLQRYVLNKTVNIHPYATDRYGRLLADISYDGKDINLEMVRIGAAWVYRQYCHHEDFFNHENLAKKAKKGLWKEKNPEAPWEFRKKKK